MTAVQSSASSGSKARIQYLFLAYLKTLSRAQIL
jgi:hypothetical protein